jgi:hypothetical protein
MALDNLSTSAALRYTEKELGGPCTETESSYGVTNVNPVICAPGNGDRVGLLMLNLSTFDMLISLASLPTTLNSIKLPSNGGYFSCNVRDDFTLPSRQWNASCTGAIGPLYVLEIIRFKQGDSFAP